VCALLGISAPASAQRLFARIDSVIGELDPSARHLGEVRRVVVVPPGCGDDDSPTWVLAHGRYLAWDTSSGLCLLDSTTGLVRLRRDVNAIVAATATGFGIVSASEGNLTLLSAPDAAPVTATVASHIPRGFGWSLWYYAIATESDVALVVETDFNPPFGGRTVHPPVLTRVSMRTGAVIDQRTLSAPVVVSAIATNATGDRLAVATRPVYGSPGGLHILDPSSGAVLASTGAVVPEPSGLAGPALTWSEASNRLLAVSFEWLANTPVRRVDVLDAVTLRSFGTLQEIAPRFPLVPGMTARWVWSQLLVDPVTSTAIVAAHESQSSGERRQQSIPIQTTLSAFDVAAMTPWGTAVLEDRVGAIAPHLPGRLFLVSPPSAPQGLSARVAGGTVSLAWRPSPGATHYTLEAGSAPGWADVAIDVGQPSFTVAAVPPGRYYVRVRGVGTGGQGPRSGEIVVTVP
jgi:hypothetical protein